MESARAEFLGAIPDRLIPVCEPLISAEDKQAVLQCLNEGWVSSTGPYVEGFEQRWAAACTMRHGIAVSNGTAALEIAAEAIDLTRGDEVILPSFTIISCAQAITKCGATPVLVDVDPQTWQMRPEQVEERLSARTKAIMVVHMYGHPVDMDPLCALAQKHGLSIIEDAAEAHGALYKGRACGGLGHISTFSFFANKLITCGEGGMILTNNEQWAARAKKKRNLCFEESRRFLHHEIGGNYRLTNMQAALALSQLERLSAVVERKNQILSSYRQRLGSHPLLRFQQWQPWASPVAWVTGLVLSAESKQSAAQFMKKLRAANIDTRPFFLGMHEQPVFHSMGLFRGERYPASEELAHYGFYVPNGLSITDSQIQYVCDTIAALLA